MSEKHLVRDGDEQTAAFRNEITNILAGALVLGAKSDREAGCINPDTAMNVTNEVVQAVMDNRDLKSECTLESRRLILAAAFQKGLDLLNGIQRPTGSSSDRDILFYLARQFEGVQRSELSVLERNIAKMLVTHEYLWVHEGGLLSINK